MNAFHVLGALFAVWAVTLTAVGITREGFPRAGRQTLLVGSVSVLLAISAIGSAIITSASKEENKGEAKQPAANARAGQTLRLSADAGGALRFDKRSLHARVGRVSLEMNNPSPLAHNISIEGGGIKDQGKTVAKGGTSTVQAQLKRGVYDFYCSVPGHRQAGMEGRLIVG